ncbi:MAG: hypothetical protein PHS83_06365 [Clostridia bacterium]|nr:hypothetical protein [Clostridia bacterium]
MTIFILHRCLEEDRREERKIKLLGNLHKIVRKKPLKKTFLEKPLTVSLWTPGGSDGCSVALELAHYVADTYQEKVVMVEWPCLGIPRLAIHVNLYDKEKNTDKLLLDFERSEDKEIYPIRYLLKFSDLISVMTINPYSAPDISINLKLKKLQTMTDLPRYLKDNLYLEGYKFIIYILQGQLHHPLTFFGVRESDQVVLNVNFPIELGWGLNCCHKLINSYNQPQQKFALYSSVLDTKTIAGITELKYLQTWESIF